MSLPIFFATLDGHRAGFAKDPSSISAVETPEQLGGVKNLFAALKMKMGAMHFLMKRYTSWPTSPALSTYSACNLPPEVELLRCHLRFRSGRREMPDGGDDWANTAGAFPQGRDDQVDSAGFEVIAGRGGSARRTFDARRTTSTSGSFLPWRVNYSNWFEMINAVRYDAFDLDGEAVSHAGNRILPSTTGNRS